MLWIFTDFQFDFKIQLQFLVFVRSLRKLRYYCKLSRLSTSCRIASTLNDKILVNRQFFYDLAKLIIRFHLLGLITLQTAFLKFLKISQFLKLVRFRRQSWTFGLFQVLDHLSNSKWLHIRIQHLQFPHKYLCIYETVVYKKVVFESQPIWILKLINFVQFQTIYWTKKKPNILKHQIRVTVSVSLS